MSVDTKELRVGADENAKRVMYLAKEFLLNNEFLDVVGGTSAAIVITRACESLVRLNYVTYADIKTETAIFHDKRQTRIVIRLRKTDQFTKLYQENEANRKLKEAERESQTEAGNWKGGEKTGEKQVGTADAQAKTAPRK